MTRAFLLCVCWVGASVRPALAQCPDGTPPPCRVARVASAAPAANSVAVLYFENLGRDTADAYLADGLTEEVTARLGQVGRLAVTSRTAVRRLRSTAATMEPVALGRALGAAYLVNGSVRRAGSRLRVTVELVRATTGARAWGDQYDRSDTDLLALQEDIARAVATGITGRLLPAERAVIASRPTRNPVAYDHYLRGTRTLNDVNPRSLGRAIAEYEAALRLDPGFTSARAAIALAYALAINWNWATPEIPPETLLARGLAAAERALREDTLSSDAWLARGGLLMFERPRTFEGVLDALRRSVAIDPENERAHEWHAIALRRLGDFEAAAASYRRASELDPSAPQAVADRGFIAFNLRRYPEAVRWYDSASVIDPTAWQNLVFRARIRLELGDGAGARADAHAAVRIGGAQRLAELVAIQVDARTGDSVVARSRLDSLLVAFAPADSIPVRDGYEIALALLATGQRQRALDVLERTRPRGPWLWTYLLFPGFDRVRQDQRFQRVFEESRPPGAPRLP